VKIVIVNAAFMKMFTHTINTWLVAHLLHPIIIIIYSLLQIAAGENNYWGGAFFFIAIFSFFASIPSFFMSWLLQYALANSNLSSIEKFIAWIISVVVAIFLNFAALKSMFGAYMGEKIDEIMVPPIIAAILSILIRHKQFFSFQLNYKSIKNENNMV
jgi:hypothetical protein